MAKILVVDDDRSLLRALNLGLQSGGHAVIVAVDGASGLSQVALSQPDVVILDMGLPDMDGLEVCSRIREWSDVPIIILSATGSESRKVAALDGGANDYVTKPFSMAELEARVRVALRDRAGAGELADDPVLDVGELHVDLVHHEARRAGRSIALTAKEFDVLSFLARHAGRTCTHQMILRAVWGAGYSEEAHYVHAYVHRLRHKLDDDDGEMIRSLPGVGYVLIDPSQPDSGN